MSNKNYCLGKKLKSKSESMTDNLTIKKQIDLLGIFLLKLL